MIQNRVFCRQQSVGTVTTIFIAFFSYFSEHRNPQQHSHTGGPGLVVKTISSLDTTVSTEQIMMQQSKVRHFLCFLPPVLHLLLSAPLVNGSDNFVHGSDNQRPLNNASRVPRARPRLENFSQEPFARTSVATVHQSSSSSSRPRGGGLLTGPPPSGQPVQRTTRAVEVQPPATTTGGQDPATIGRRQRHHESLPVSVRPSVHESPPVRSGVVRSTQSGCAVSDSVGSTAQS